MSFAEKIIRTSNIPIHYIWGEDAQGRLHHWFLMCSAERYTALRPHFNNGVKIEDYGIVVAEGSGKKPSPKTKEMLIEKFGFNPDEYFSYS